MGRWGADFDPDRLAVLETAMWKAYYRRQPARLFGLLVQGLREQAHVSWPRALAAGFFLTKGAAGFARSTGDYDRFAPDIARGYRCSGCRRTSTRRRSPGASCAGGSSGARSGWRRARPPARRSPGCTRRCTTCRETASPRRAGCAARPPRSAIAARPPIRTGRRARGLAYWPEVARLLRRSYRSCTRRAGEPVAGA